MRPVNLIPRDGRGGRAGAGGSVVGYALLGVLALVLLGVVALVLTGNSIEEKKAELASIEEREAALSAQVAELQPYTEFASLAASREQTIRDLADSRFDWERVLNELALVLPEDVWLTGLTGTVSPDVQLDTGADVPSRGDVPAPALELVGCAASQDSVANFVSVLRDIDGVTRVGLDASERPDSESGGSSNEDCRTEDFIPEFKIVVAFDAATEAAAAAPSTEPVPAMPAPAAPAPGGDAAAEVQGEQQATEDSAAQADEGAAAATNVAAEVTP